MIKFLPKSNRFVFTNDENGQFAIDERQVLNLFGENLKELRGHCGISLQELAKLLEIPNQTISSYENKRHMPSLMQAIKISAYFDLTVEEFILCGLDEYPYDIVELYERRKKGL